MRRHAQHFREHTQEMKRTQPGLRRGPVEVEWLMRALVQPERSFHCAPTVASMRFQFPSLLTAGSFDEAHRHQERCFIETDVRIAIGSGLCKLT